MDTDQLVNIALAVVTPILTAGFGVLGLVVGDWRQRRTQAGRRKLAFEDASRQVAFAADWWNARKLLADSPEAEQQATTRAQAWLDEASAQVAESKHPPVEKPTITLRRLLLAYPMQSRAARVLRGIFFLVLGYVPGLVGSAICAALGRPDTLGIPRYFQDEFFGDAVFIAGAMVVAIALRFWALRVEKSVATSEKRNRMTLRRALLLYRFHRPAARVARILFYLWAASYLLLTVIGLFVMAAEDPGLIPGEVIMLSGFVGWTVALRYWAASLDARAAGEMSRVASTDSALTASQQPIPIGGTPVDAPLQQQLLPSPGWYPNPAGTDGQAYRNGRAWDEPPTRSGVALAASRSE